MPKTRAQLVVELDDPAADLLGLLERFAQEEVFWPEVSALADAISLGPSNSAHVDQMCARMDILFDGACTSHDTA